MGSVTDTTPPALPYWQVNIPPAERESICPEFLRNLSPKDEGIIGTPDSQYQIATWAQVQQVIADNRLDLFRRVPSQLRRYLEYTWKLKREHGSVMDFVLSERLRWAPAPAAGDDDAEKGVVITTNSTIRPQGKEPFECEDDVKILWNDWPYGIDPKIVHLVVWTKFELDEDPVTLDLTDRARTLVDEYVADKFGRCVPRDRVSRCVFPFELGEAFMSSSPG